MKLADVLRDLSIHKPFIVTGNSLATKTDVIEQVKKAAGCQIAGVFASIKQHAPIQDIKNAVDELKKSKGDGIIAVGGGSPIDASKVIISFYNGRNGYTAEVDQYSNNVISCRTNYYCWLYR